MLMLRRFKSHLPPQGHSPRSRPQRSNSALTATFVPTANPAHPRSFRPYFIAIPATSSLNACFSVSTQLHLDDDQMRDLMRQIVNRLYTFHMCCDDPAFLALAERWMTVAGKWDEPELDRAFLGAIKYGAEDPAG